MQITRPDYYKKFSCIADACPDTCCAGWQIVIDDKSLKKYRHFKGTFRNRLHNDIDWKEQIFRQYNRRCAFLNEENLCDIYTEAGKRMLCETCRRYPRHVEEFEGLREYSLSLSCPEVARILLEKQDKTKFHTATVPAPEEAYDDFDYLLFTALMDTRDFLLETIQNRKIPMRLRMWKLLAVASDFQRCLDRNELFRWEEIRKRHRDSGYGEIFTSKAHSRLTANVTANELLKEMWQTIVPQMEVLRPGWLDFLSDNLEPLYGAPAADVSVRYRQHCEDFQKAYPDWNIQEEQLLVYWIYTYFCGAVYDDEIFAKVKMAVVCTLLIHELDMGMYLKNGRIFCLEDQIDICYRFSRELEHSDLNLNALEELLSRNKLFSLGNLLRIC